MGKELQRALLWVILLGALFMLWDNYQVYKGGTSFFGPAKEQTVQNADQPAANAIPAPTPNAQQAVAATPVEAVSDPVIVTTDRMKLPLTVLALV